MIIQLQLLRLLHSVLVTKLFAVNSLSVFQEILFYDLFCFTLFFLSQLLTDFSFLNMFAFKMVLVND